MSEPNGENGVNGDYFSKGKDAKLREELNSIYTPLSVAREEIWKRWNDKKLRKKVESFWNGDVPEIFKQAPRAVLSRQVPSPNLELMNFLNLANYVDLKKVFFEYSCDKFVTKNNDKYYLGKMFFYEGSGKKGGRKTSSVKIIDIDKYDGKLLSDVKTLWGEGLINFHRNLLKVIVPDADIFDVSCSFKDNGSIADRYYLYYLSLFICHGILFENFLAADYYDKLTKEILLPNYKKIKEIFGVNPLIVPLVPFEDEDDLYWRYYPISVKEKMFSVSKGCARGIFDKENKKEKIFCF